MWETQHPGATGAGMPSHATAAGTPNLAQIETTEQPSPGIVRIIARRVAWPGLGEKPNRAGLRLRWDALTEGGDVLAVATETPFLDGALALLRRGLDPATLVTMRHEGATGDSFVPAPLSGPAAAGERRAADRARLAARRARQSQRTADLAPDGQTPTETANGLPVSEAAP